MSDQILVSKDLIKGLAQHAADTSAMFMPLSGFAMMGAAMLAKRVGELIGEDIQPSETAYNGTVNMVSRIRGEADATISKLSKDLDELRMKHTMCPIDMDEFEDPEEEEIEDQLNIISSTENEVQALEDHLFETDPNLADLKGIQ